MCKVDILIATYNGEHYLRQQLLSIIAQDCTDWKVLIHDDGSTDSTVQIIREFCDRDTRFVFIDDGICFRSPALNFMHLLQFSSNEFICFCDQDDIWIENKLSLLLQNFEETSIPAALVSAGYIFTNECNHIRGLLNYQIHNLSELLFVNGGIHGSRCMINSAMRKQMLKYSGPLDMHDHLMAQIACSFGQISYIETPLFFYRQHTYNVTGNIIVNPVKRFFEAFRSIRTKFLISREIYECNHSFANVFASELSDSDKKLIGSYLRYPDSRLWQRVIILLRFKFSIGARGRCHLLLKALTRKCFD